MLLAPVVGALLAVVLVPVVLTVDRLTSGPPLLPAALAVALLAVLTRGLHLDGLADLADGLGSYRSPEQARAVMKAPDVGALGLAAVVLVLLVQVAALSACLSAGRGGTALLVALLTARVAVAAACRAGVPAAAPTGLGALVAGTVAGWAPAVLAGGTALAGAAAVAVEQSATGPRLALPALAVTAGLGAAALLQRHAVRRIGGITGDVLGALVEVTTAVVLVVLALQL
jgi:adenosylcobinamide-GDP ribazoletransferase